MRSTVLSLLLLAALAGPSLASPIRGFFNDPINGRPNGLDTALVELIDGAQTRVDAHFFQIGRQNIVDALVRAAGRLGPCNVRIISDEEYMSNPTYEAYYEDLMNAGITIVTPACDGFGPQSNHSHNKFAIADILEVYTGGYNITDFATHLYHEDAVIVRHPGVAQAYLDEFNEMWGSTGCIPDCIDEFGNDGASRFGENKFDNTEKVFDVEGRQVEVYFSPGDGVRAQILEELSNVQQGVYFCMFSFTRRDIADKIMEAYYNGKDVLGVIDRQGAENAFGAQYPAMKDVIPVKKHNEVTPHTNILHHKFGVIDPFGDDPRVITGSYNWTSAAETRNDENTIIIRDRELAEAYYCQVYERYHGTPCVKPPRYVEPTPTPTPAVADEAGVYVTGAKDVYQPGEEVTFSFSLYNKKAQGFEASVYLTMEVAGAFLYIPSFDSVRDPYRHNVDIPAGPWFSESEVFLGPFPSPGISGQPLTITVTGELYNKDTGELEDGVGTFTSTH